MNEAVFMQAMSGRSPSPLPARHAFGETRAARRFVAAVLCVTGLAVLTEYLIARVPGLGAGPQGTLFPRAFWISSALLLFGSVKLSRALTEVRREKQQPFRRSLLTALVTGGLFVGVQTFGLWSMIPHDRTPQAAQEGMNVFLFMLSSLHAIHFVVAVLFLSFITVRALDDRYDHEYHWGVTVCTYFWHALGVVWLAILVVFAIAAT